MLIALVPAACGNGATGGGGPQTKLHVLAAASLTGAFTQLGVAFTEAHPGVAIVFDFAGSQELVAQMRQGAPADVFAPADEPTMAKVAGLVATPRVFAANQLAIAVIPGDPEGIEGLADLAREDLKVILAAPEVPAGRYAQLALDAAGVLVAPVSLEESVKGVVTKVSLGEADAGIVYVTDVAAAAGRVQGVTVPAAQNVTARYPIAVVRGSSAPAEARLFVDFVLSAEGQRTLRSFGFLPPDAP